MSRLTRCRMAVFATLIALSPDGRAAPRCDARAPLGITRPHFVQHFGSGPGLALEEAWLTCRDADARGACSVAELSFFAKVDPEAPSSVAGQRPGPRESSAALILTIRRGPEEPFVLRSGLELPIVFVDEALHGAGQWRASVIGTAQGALVDHEPGAERGEPFGMVRIDAIEGRGAALKLRGSVAICVDRGTIAGPFAATQPTDLFGLRPLHPLRISTSGTESRVLLDGMPTPESSIGLGTLGGAPRKSAPRPR